MKKEYDFSGGVKNPYAKRLKNQKQQITINIDYSTIEYFRREAVETGMPYQTLINLYLRDCSKKKRKLQLDWV